VRRVIGLLPGGQVALRVSAIRCGDLQVEVAARVTLLARHGGMTHCQREIDGRRAVIHRRTQPVVEAWVAKLALARGKFRRSAGMRRRSRVLPILHVAGLAGRREPQILPGGGILVAFLALDDRMGAEQRKPVVVLLDRLNRHVPAQNGVAFGAVGAHLAAMNVGVAIRAVFSNVGKYGL